MVNFLTSDRLNTTKVYTTKAMEYYNNCIISCANAWKLLLFGRCLYFWWAMSTPRGILLYPHTAHNDSNEDALIVHCSLHKLLCIDLRLLCATVVKKNKYCIKQVHSYFMVRFYAWWLFCACLGRIAATKVNMSKRLLISLNAL